MTRPKITGNEWKVVHMGREIYIETDSVFIADLQAREASDLNTANADAKAIAAVPALLEALERANALIGDLAKGATLTGPNLEAWAKTVAVLLPKEAEKAQSALNLAGYTF